SVNRRARFSGVRSVSGSGPPAARTASATRSPGARVTNPGRATRPTTLTTSSWGGLLVGAAAGGVNCGGASSTRGRAPQTETTTPATRAAASTTNTSTPAQPGSTRAPTS